MLGWSKINAANIFCLKLAIKLERCQVPRRQYAKHKLRLIPRHQTKEQTQIAKRAKTTSIGVKHFKEVPILVSFWVPARDWEQPIATETIKVLSNFKCIWTKKTSQRYAGAQGCTLALGVCYKQHSQVKKLCVIILTRTNLVFQKNCYMLRFMKIKSNWWVKQWKQTKKYWNQFLLKVPHSVKVNPNLPWA